MAESVAESEPGSGSGSEAGSGSGFEAGSGSGANITDSKLEDDPVSKQETDQGTGPLSKKETDPEIKIVKINN